MARLRAGVIGLGILGKQHAQFLHDRDAVELVAVADIRVDVAQQVGTELAAQPFQEYKEMFQKHALDLVVVATPDSLHRAPTLAAIEAGVPNILQEKPLATTLEDANAIYEAVERTQTRLFINFSNRMDKLDIATRYTVQNGLLGKVVHGEVRLDDNIIVPTEMWGARTKEWVAGSSTCHFLLSHVIDILRWYFAPAEVADVYAISQSEVLGYTPDLYDAFLTFDSGLKVRIKAGWIQHIDEMVEFAISMSGSTGTLIYNKLGGFGVDEGWRVNLSPKHISQDALLQHQAILLAKDINVAALIHKSSLTFANLAMGDDQLALALEKRGQYQSEAMPLVPPILDAILEGTTEPAQWSMIGTLPTHIDGLRQVQVADAIIRSCERGESVSLA
ncbi:Gfo/Idh/MocA family oxidoreductase [Chloroflexi bacterium TSY]|nr:Gfo/Idh/MocA family oxidoreductase [Chloroflexi bacterium TSY]